MPDPPTRLSPVHHLLEPRRPEWMDVGGGRFAARFDTVEAERAAMQTLGLCDVSGLAKLGVKGPGCESWLTGQGFHLPSGIYDAGRLAGGGLIVRLAADEFLLEGGISGDVVPALDAAISSGPGGVFRIERQEAAFVLVGSRAPEAMAQTCGVNLGEAARERLVLTRVAGVNCGVFPDAMSGVAAFRIWVDPSYAVYLWETLAQVCEDLDGRVIGAACLFPELR